MTKITRQAREEAYLRLCLLASFPSCEALVQLFILAIPLMIASKWATTYIRGLSWAYNAWRAYFQVRLEKTKGHTPIEGRYNNLPVTMPKSSDHSRVLSVNQVVSTCLGKESLQISISIMAIRLGDKLKHTFHTRHLLSLIGPQY